MASAGEREEHARIGSSRPGADAADRIGVFGGTFDPPHLGHAIAARDVADALALDRVLWVPAAIPPHKTGRTITPGVVRRRLVEAAVADDPRFELCDLELERGGVSYTVDTLRRLKADHPRAALSLVLGSDLATRIGSWKEPGAVVELARPVVVLRAGAEPVEAGGRAVAAGMRAVRVTPVDVSSSGVRDRVRRRLAVCDMVSPAVMAIIEREGLYRA